MSFKKRIATSFMLATALLILVLFGIVYFIVKNTVYQNIDKDLIFEAKKHTKEIKLVNGTIHFINMNEWKEREHREIQVNPVFLQINDEDGAIRDKSPNLKGHHLHFFKAKNKTEQFNSKLMDLAIRQIQIPVIKNGTVKGYIVAAMSLEASLMVLSNLKTVLYISFPIVLIGLFFFSSYLAGRNIQPVVDIMETTQRITKQNLKDRVQLPLNKDELYYLSSSINDLLDRIQLAMEREQQFTSDASHELRTPLSVLRGTLEVLIRKPRTPEEYEKKIEYSLTEIDRLAFIIDQLLEIARQDINVHLNGTNVHSVTTLIEDILVRRKTEMDEKRLTISITNRLNEEVHIHGFYGQLILDNIIGNALKYSHEMGRIEVELVVKSEALICRITDFGIGIKQEDLSKLFIPFFRSDALEHKQIKGTGLGLSIVQKAAQLLKAEVNISSIYGEGTTVELVFKEILRKA